MEITYASPSSRDLLRSSPTASGSAMPIRPVKIIPLQHPDTTSYGSPGGFGSSPSSFRSSSLFSGVRGKIKRMTFVDWIEMFLPCCRWIRTYRWREYFQIDLMAGITVGVMLVPQAMSYAKLAGLDPIYGLYSGFVPIFIYAIFGSSRQLAIGPVALVSLLVSNVLSKIADSSDALYTELAILLALMVGILECIMGLLRLGWLIRFISHSVISGFTTASAFVIALSQAKYFLGYEIDRSSEIVPIIKSIISGADQGKSRKRLKFLRAMGPLTAVVLGTTFVKIYHPPSITLVGDIPQGIPSFSIPKSFQYAKSLIPTALLITGVAILESVGIAKALAAKNGYELDSNQEVLPISLGHSFQHTQQQCALAAIVISAVISLVGVSLAFVIHESANPHIAVLGRLPGTTVYRNIEQYPEAYTYNGIVIVRIDAPIYFANISYIKDRLREYEVVIDKSARRGPDVERIYYVILEMAPVTYIDSSAVQALKDLHQEYKSRDIQIAISNPNREVLLTLSKSGVVELIGKEWYFVRVHDAVQVCLQHVQSITESPKASDPSHEGKSSFFQRILKQRAEDSLVSELESGNNTNNPSDPTHEDPRLEPLLSRRS
ncbi:hypothetical protein V6N11_070571 [Hibiscus sabdariffa]|uniref:STAS domain-containing protein n=1 Tax=Hibiscus sabdariffa TaxID=183260 RepID=A0ABR2QFH9_9ROSI